ncbi:calcium-binding protein (plasmid) [Thioclava sp. 'Guangxiensis']|uniref:calcium-binding protein n=1 Tax=Thioclava sp. 'Guangxiensis' TaxID=3149044 RepID=UPI0032C3DE84
MASSSDLSATGNPNPTLALNLAALSDWSAALPFLDLMKTMRPWLGHEAGNWGAQSTADLVEAGIFDENGWPTEIPDGLSKIGTVWDWTASSAADPDLAEQRAGVYVLEYEGEGTIQLRGDVKILSQEDGKIVFENVSGNTWEMLITATDPEGTGAYIRDVTVVAQEHVDLFEAGAVFNPDWVALIDDARQIRFMDWMKTNNSSAVTAEDLVSGEDRGLSVTASVEDMVRLANEIGADPWFCMPHMADESYIRAFATYVRDTLDPALTVRIEYSNEAWNTMFSVNSWLSEQVASEWGLSGQEARDAYYVKMATQSALIWADVFGEEAEERLVNILSTQALNTWRTQRLLEAEAWQDSEPESYVDPATVFDELAITTYFGTNPLNSATTRAEILGLVNGGDMAGAVARVIELTQAHLLSSAETWAAQAELAHAAGLDLVAYEGGQHIHTSFSTSGLSSAEVTALQQVLTDAVASTEMVDLYAQCFEIWTEIADGPFMQYVDVASASGYGSWGLYTSLMSQNDRATLLNELNEITAPWWETDGGAQYMQGIVVQGDDTDEIIAGTSAEDYLTGGAGDDTLIAGAGNDGLNGGAGTDRLVLEGTILDYTLVAQEDSYLLYGGDGTKFLRNIEEIYFSGSEQLVTLEEFETARAAAEAAATLPGEPDIFLLDLSAHSEDMLVLAIDPSSELGGEIGADGRDLFYAEAGSTGLIDGVEVGLDATTIQENALTEGGAALSASARETAEILGDLAFGVEMLVMGAGDDSVTLGAGDEVVYGMGGNDVIEGGAGNDWLMGGEGDDTLDGGAGDDLLIGGAGQDRFEIIAHMGHDTITDLTPEDYVYLRDSFKATITDLYSSLSEVEGGLLLSNDDNSSSVLFVGMTMEDADWIF